MRVPAVSGASIAACSNTSVRCRIGLRVVAWSGKLPTCKTSPINKGASDLFKRLRAEFHASARPPSATFCTENMRCVARCDERSRKTDLASSDQSARLVESYLHCGGPHEIGRFQ